MDKRSIRDILREIVKENEEIYSLVCRVDAVDETERTVDVTPINGGAPIFGVRLQSAINSDKGFVQIPKTGSDIVVTFMSKNTGFVSVCEEVEKVLIDCDEVTFNGGGNEGLVIVQSLVDKINRLENKVNSLVTKFNVHTHVASSFGAPTTPPPTPETAITPTTLKSDLENTKIKH